MKNYIIYRCKICGCEFILPRQYIKVNDDKGNYITCPYRGHKQITVVGAYDNIKECMDNHVFVREGRRMRQMK